MSGTWLTRSKRTKRRQRGSLGAAGLQPAAAPIRPVPAIPIFNGSSIVCDMASAQVDTCYTMASNWRAIDRVNRNSLPYIHGRTDGVACERAPRWDAHLLGYPDPDG